MRKNFFTLRVTEHWNRMPRGVGGVSFSGDIQNPPGGGPVLPVLGEPVLAGGLDWISRGPFQPPPFCDKLDQKICFHCIAYQVE